MFEQLSQYQEIGFRILQAVVGLIFIVHGIGKVKNPSQIATVYKAPAVAGLVHGLIEVLGGIALILNWLTDITSLLLGLIMIGAIYFKMFKWKVPFMAQNATGWEFDLLLLAANIAILVR